MNTPQAKPGQQIYNRPPRSELYDLYWDDCLTLSEIGEKYGVSLQVVWLWMVKYEIPRRPAAAHYRIREIRGVKHKKCKGILHPEGKWVPLSEYWNRPDGAPRPHCKKCEYARQGAEPTLPLEPPYTTWITGIVNRLGVMEASRRLEISQSGLWQLRNGKRKRLKRKTARKIVALFHELAESGEVRHRDSIRHGSYLRGRKEKTPTAKRHYYKPHGDGDSENRRNFRKEHIEHEREMDKKRKARKYAGLTPD